MAASLIVKHFTDGSITLADGTGTPVTLAVAFTEGDFSVDNITSDNKSREVNAYEARGVVTSLRRGKRVFPTCSFSCQLADYSDATERTVLDFIRKKGSYASNVSTTQALGDVYTLNATLTIEGTDLTDPSDHTIVISDAHFVAEFAEGEPNKLTLTGTVYGNVNMT